MEEEDSQSRIKSPLLIPSPEDGVVGQNRSFFINKAEILIEFKTQMYLAGPLVLVSFLQYSLQMISLMFLGHLDELSLSGASMATSFTGVTGFSFMLGMGGAVETLCGQANGAREYHMLGVHAQRAMLILSFTSIPVSVLWASTRQVFLFFKQDPQISIHAGNYAVWLIPSILPYGLLQCQFRLLQTQNIVTPLMLSTGCTSLIHVIMCRTLIYRFGFGYKGAALSIAISYWANVFMLALYIKFSSACQKTWTGFSKESLKNLPTFLKLGIPSALMVCFEQWSYECLVLMSGLLPNPKLETSMMSISLNTGSVIFRIPYGFGSVVSTRVSNELGAGRARAARLAVQIATFLAVMEGLSLNLSLVAVRGVWGYMYTNQEEVARYLASIMPVLAISNFMDAMQAIFSGTARGCGWQKTGALVNLGAYYIVGLPAAIILAFVFHLGGRGLWVGIILGSSLQAIMLMIITIRTDWEQEVKKARDRVHSCSIPRNVVNQQEDDATSRRIGLNG